MLLMADCEQHLLSFWLLQVPVIWMFAPMPASDIGDIFPPWASAFPETGRIEPKARQHIKISVFGQQAKIFAERSTSELLDKVRRVQWSNECFTTQAPNE